MKRVIFRYASGIEATVFSKLEKEGLIRVVGCICYDDDDKTRVSELFKDASVSVSTGLFKNGLRGNFADVDLRLLTPEVLDGVCWAEPIALEMMDRIDPAKNTSYQERKGLFKYLLCYWLGEIARARPDCYYCRSAPHEVSDFVLYALCRHFGIGVKLFIYTSIPGIFLMADDYRQPFRPLHDALREFSGSRIDWKDISLPAREHIRKLKASYRDGAPKYLLDLLQDDQRKHELFERVKRRTKEKFLGLKRKVEQASGLVAATLGHEGARREYLVKKKEACAAKLVRDDWKALLPKYKAMSSKKPDFEKPYVYFPLHLQPEETTCPLGGRFSDQILAASLMAKCLPSGWKLYVKEHKSQFFDRTYGHIGRSAIYYEMISAIKDVELVPLDADPFLLIDKARCVATVTGTSGWEAVVRGKPAIVFGEAWYQDAPNVYRVYDSKTCAAALQEISNDPRTDEEELKRFVYAVERLGVELDFNEAYASWRGKAFDQAKSSEAFQQVLLKAVNGDHDGI